MPPQSRLTVKNVHEVTIVTFSETSIIEAQLIENIKREMFALVEDQERSKLVLNLSKVQYLSSSALGVLIPLHEKTKERGGRLILCGVNQDIRKVFKITKLDKLFTFKKDETDALAEFGVRATP
ncbi:MAG: STAS domain-containing protein [bacterium]|nr:STAS domain-containing protein [bacterium]